MEDTLRRMERLTPRGWDMFSYENLGDWASELEGVHRSLTLDKHQLTFVKLGDLVTLLGRPLPVEDRAEPESQGLGTRGKGKETAATSVEETEEVLLYDPLVSRWSISSILITDPVRSFSSAITA